MARRGASDPAVVASGYARPTHPHGVKGEDIPLGARVIRVVDSFSAMIDERPYKQAREILEAIDEIKDHAGTTFDPDVVKAFLKVVESA